MQQVTGNVWAETRVRGCNFGYLVTSEGIVMFDSPQLPSESLKLKAEIDRKGKLLYIINTEPHADHWTGNGFFDVPVIAQEGVRTRILDTNAEEHRARTGSLGPGEDQHMKGYQANAPVITFKNGMTLNIGKHTLELIHMPGHTMHQIAVVIKEEGVAWTSDNIFRSVQSWLHEANPDLWLQAVESLRKVDAETFVPGHGELCGKDYLDEQGAFVLEWKNYVKDAIDRGVTRDEAVATLNGMIDRYPMDVGQAQLAPAVMKMNVGNLYDYLTGNWQPNRPQPMPALQRN